MRSEYILFESGPFRLRGKWHFPVNTSPENRRPAVIVVTGLGGNLDWFEPLAENLAGEGLASFCFDFRGHGGSEGLCDENLTQDILSAVEEVKKHPYIQSDKLFLIGQCMGGVISAHLAEEIEHLLGVAIFSPLREQRVVESPESWKKVMKAMFDPDNPHQVKLDEESFLKLYTANDILKTLKNRSFPVFLSFGTHDKYLTEEIRTRISENAQREGDQIYEMKNGRHTAGYREGAIGKRVARWITQTISMKEKRAA